jgi:hypothetical protein
MAGENVTALKASKRVYRMYPDAMAVKEEYIVELSALLLHQGDLDDGTLCMQALACLLVLARRAFGHHVHRHVKVNNKVRGLQLP